MNLLPLIASANTVNKNLGSSFIALHHDFKYAAFSSLTVTEIPKYTPDKSDINSDTSS